MPSPSLLRRKPMSTAMPPKPTIRKPLDRLERRLPAGNSVSKRYSSPSRRFNAQTRRVWSTLAMPRRFLIDGYNLLHAIGLPNRLASGQLHHARARLVSLVGERFKRDEITIV